MIVFPNAKINIGLFVTNERVDGYHDIETIMYPIPWCDILEIVPSKSETSSLSVTGRGVDCPPEKNLVMKAYRLLDEAVELPPVDIFLHKVIPDGAGLGGGSADAAFTLMALNRMFSLGLADAELADMASSLGADCPFFIYNKPMLATGVGTDLSPIDFDMSGKSLVVVKPDEKVSTAEAYSEVKVKPANIDLSTVLKTLNPLCWEKEGVVNDFEASVFPSHGSISEIKDVIKRSGAVYASMSGSGSAVYGIFEDDKLAEDALSRLGSHLCFKAKFDELERYRR